MATATLRTVGNSVAVVIPKQWLEVLKLQAGSQVELALDGNRLTLQAPIKTPRKNTPWNKCLLSVILVYAIRAMDLQGRDAKKVETVPENIVDEVLAKLAGVLGFDEC